MWQMVYQNIFDLLIFIILYILPMILIFYTYTRVVKVLWKLDNSITWDETSTKTNKNGSNSNQTLACGSSKAKTKIILQLNSRRKAAKMLISVAVIFAICYLPNHLLNIIR